MPISRRDILKSLTITAITGSVLRVIPLEAAEYAHRMVRAERAAAAGSGLRAQVFLRSRLQDAAVALPDHHSIR